ncbi:hypothetical protein GCM10020255_085860 [Rhodococcus baikonurensis]
MRLLPSGDVSSRRGTLPRWRGTFTLLVHFGQSIGTDIRICGIDQSAGACADRFWVRLLERRDQPLALALLDSDAASHSAAAETVRGGAL